MKIAIRIENQGALDNFAEVPDAYGTLSPEEARTTFEAFREHLESGKGPPVKRLIIVRFETLHAEEPANVSKH